MMAGVSLYEYQLQAVEKLRTGKILCGGVGSGKSRTALGYFYKLMGGEFNTKEYVPMVEPIKDLYIITTARKRDTAEWEGELTPFFLSADPSVSRYHNTVVIDSWNNIKKYAEVRNAFFIFDEQRVVGSGAWVKAFLRIARYNDWILLSATPGDTWQDYIPVFVANGFYRNKTEFIQNHVVYSRFSKYPKVERYLNTGRLTALRNQILVNMDYHKKTQSHHQDVYVDFDPWTYKNIVKFRWDIWSGEPLESASEFCFALRKLVNTDPSRLRKAVELVQQHRKAIIFYNFDYELEMLRTAPWGDGVEVAEWNGHRHQPLPGGTDWVYLVQYTAGAEGWNCDRTDTMIFFSQNYSYKIMIQSAGRIDRLNTPYTDLYYYHLKSRSGIDLAIAKALGQKKKFNESGFYQNL